MTRRRSGFAIATLVFFAGCTGPLAVDGQEVVMVLEVAADSVPCVGEMVGSCLQVRSPGEDEWRKFYDSIEGFEHEPGVSFTLRVVRTRVPDPPADASAFHWRLLEIIGREPGDGSPA